MPKLTVKDQPKKEPKSRLSPDAPDVHWDDSDLIPSEDDPCWEIPNKPKKLTPVKSKKILSPSELNLSLRSKYGIPLSVSRYQIDGYLTPIQDQNHKYFLKRYAINGKEFDVCWLLCNGGN